MRTTCLPLCVPDAVAVSHVKILNSETETGKVFLQVPSLLSNIATWC